MIVPKGWNIKVFNQGKSRLSQNNLEGQNSCNSTSQYNELVRVSTTPGFIQTARETGKLSSLNSQQQYWIKTKNSHKSQGMKQLNIH